MSSRRLLLPVVAALIAVPATLPAQGWEGTIRTREISFHAGLFADRIGDTPTGVLDLPLADILAAADRPDGTEDVEVTEATLKLKGTRIRTDMLSGEETGMPEGYGIMHVDQGLMYLVMPAQRTIMEMNVAQIEAMMAEVPQPDAPEPPPIEPLNETRVVNGVRCQGYRIRGPDGLTIAWVSKEDAALHALYEGFSDLVRRMDPEGTDPDLRLAPYGFPMLTYTISGDDVTIEETIAIEPGPVPDSEFALPAGYQRMSMLDMMRGND